MKVIENGAKVIEKSDEPKQTKYYEPSENEKELISFIIDHTDRWREYRDQNFMDDWDKYERIFRSEWKPEDKQRESERSRVISPASQQAVETRHAEMMEAIFGQGEFFDIKDPSDSKTSPIYPEQLKKQLIEDFGKDKVRKSFDQIELLAEIYGTGIGEITVGFEKTYSPAAMPTQNGQVMYGVDEKERFYVRLNPIHPKNFIFDPNGTSIDDCMGVAIERNVSIHKIAQKISSGDYNNVDISPMYEDDDLEPTQEAIDFRDNKLKVLTYYGLVPKEYIDNLPENKNVVKLFDDELEDYTDMVEAIVIIANGNLLLKATENPYSMKDRPVLSYQDDTVPNRLLGRGTMEKAFNMQMAIDGSARVHMDSLALTSAPMMGIDVTRWPRGMKFEVKPGKSIGTNGNPNEILFPLKFGTTDGQAMETSKEFERMLLMATSTIDSNGQVTQVSRDSNMDMATATMIKKYKRGIVNRQEDFIIPFVKKAAWRYMQFDPQRYPSVDVKFLPTATLGIIAREYEQKQLAFLIQTLGADSKLTPILMDGILANSSLSNREEMRQFMQKASQPDPQAQQLAQQEQQAQVSLVAAQAEEVQAKAQESMASARNTDVKTQLAPEQLKVEIMSALSKNLPPNSDSATAEFDRRVKIAELLLKEKDINTKASIVEMQTHQQAMDAQMKANEHIMKIDEHVMKKKEHSQKLKGKKMTINTPSGETYTAQT